MMEIIIIILMILLMVSMIGMVIAIFIAVRHIMWMAQREKERKEIMFDKLPTLEDVIKEEKKKRKRGKK